MNTLEYYLTILLQLVNLDRCMRSCNSLNDLPNKVTAPNITKDETVNASDSVSTNVTSIVSANFHNKKARYKMDCFNLHIVLLAIILLFIVVIICYHYAKNRSKLKNILPC